MRVCLLMQFSLLSDWEKQPANCGRRGGFDGAPGSCVYATLDDFNVSALRNLALSAAGEGLPSIGVWNLSVPIQRPHCAENSHVDSEATERGTLLGPTLIADLAFIVDCKEVHRPRA